MSVDRSISLLDNLREDTSLESQLLSTQEENSYVEINVNGLILRQEKTINHNRCCKQGLLLSLVVNIALITVIILFLCFKMNFIRKPVEEKNLTSLCVLENYKSAVCSDHSKHLQYIMNVMQTSPDSSKSPAIAQSFIGFTRNKGIRNKKMLTKVDQDKIAFINHEDNEIVIEKSSPYLLSIQLLFKRDSSWNNSTKNVIVTVTQETRNGNQNAAELMTQLALIPDDMETLQTFSMMDIFNLKKGDTINLIVSAPRLLYNCKTCNKITAIEVV